MQTANKPENNNNSHEANPSLGKAREAETMAACVILCSRGFWAKPMNDGKRIRVLVMHTDGKTEWSSTHVIKPCETYEFIAAYKK